MLVLGIESSCDECAAAVVACDSGAIRLLGQRIASQIPIHAPYGGVVPELASRDHVRRIVQVIAEALDRAGVGLRRIDGFGVTAGPGLIGSLLIGVSAAKALAYSSAKPLVGVNHLEAHLHAVRLERAALDLPCLGLVVSGGHTSLFELQGLGRGQILGRTRDDAAGEALDKVAKLLGLPYPGGLAIERAARGGDPAAIRFPRPLPGRQLDFSFSGLKTAAALHVKREGLPQGPGLADFAASFQEAIVDSLVRKTLLAARKRRLARVVVAGGVAANLRLREELERRGAGEIECLFPSVALCTDNAAMVAALAASYLEQGRDDGLALDADAMLPWPGD
ncbi:MAG: tRNA (adenosine(37)-N6)-threonylcarbamoyltransferase complex transferase subunit TsaD [Deltaproteobacteria bacterium]|nr:tRNA (adenosine(37)-N6)-threonylcarbamoyltransferase complex transferase subunit TsaD [Deltaproteobacteria bacterium]